MKEASGIAPMRPSLIWRTIVVEKRQVSQDGRPKTFTPRHRLKASLEGIALGLRLGRRATHGHPGAHEIVDRSNDGAGRLITPDRVLHHLSIGLG